LKFDRERSAVTAGDFVQETLVSKLGMRTLVVGENFACGRGRQGNVGYLVDLGVRLGFEVHPVPLRPQTCVERGTHCSSTEVRRLLRQGDIASANAMLDRAHELSTTVFGSRQSAARVIDVVVPSGMCLPPAGDYAGSVKKRGKTAPWIDAMLQIREDHPQFAERAVRLHLDRDMDAARGDAMVVRFLGKVNASIGDVAFAAAVAN
jgi:riboflavin kinase/FMN adenylyltransferase